MLPVELIDDIFSLLDSATLESCILAHPFLADIAGPYFYSRISVANILDFSTEEASFYAPTTLFDRPSSEHACVAQHIRSLEIDISTHSSWEDELTSFPSNVLKPFTEYWENISSRLQNSNLERLQLRVWGTNWIKWLKLPKSFRVSLAGLLQSSPKLKQVFLDVKYFPLSLLTGCKSLKYISLTGDFSRGATGLQHSHPLLLESLSIHRAYTWPNIVSWAIPHTAHLHSLSLGSFSSDNCSKFTPLLVACSDTLTGLELDLDRNFLADYHINTRTHIPSVESDIPLNLSILHRLENLTIHGRIDVPDYSKEKYLTSLLAISRLLESALPLKRLTLRLRFKAKHRVDDFDWLSDMDWDPVARFIPQHATDHPVDLHVTFFGIFVRRSAKAITPLQDNVHLKRLVTQGLLTVETYR